MSRKIIRDFIKQADKLDNEQAARYFDTIMEVYEDSAHTPDERIAYLETDTLWLLVEYRKIVEAKDNTPEEKQQHHTAQSNLSILLSGLIASTADKGIYLSEAFIRKYENVDFVSFPFGDFVRDVYKVRKWQSPEPQQAAIAAPQQPDKSSSGEMTGNGNETRPEGNNEESEYIKLPLELQTKDNRAEKIFTEAYNNGWIIKTSDSCYQWIGFGNKRKKGGSKSSEMKCAYLCAQTYGYYKDGYYHNADGNSPPWNELGEFFGIEKLSGFIGDVETVKSPQSWRQAIDNLISSAIE